ncbi:short-chain dehydrogenase [Gordoniibacillus kamchatkensis]|uniref:Short-chain dehydrogenase n=2 Tax=Gordoniibacillus kamchatkensis TaxID=1590651 RepID=A0ABR5AK69_9BACL|nr:short-chain dehydrogenase [Paenibacillus sp. VKM B-2647]
MKDKVAIVTGGARGIGAAASKALGQRGAKVVVNYLSNKDAAHAVVAEIQAAGGDAAAYQADVRDETQAGALASFARDAFGGRIDILVNNANVPFAVMPFADMPWSAFSQKVNEELKAAFLMTKAVIPAMTEQKYGKIVYVSAGLGKAAAPNMIAHGTAKGALDTFAKYIAHEFGPMGITANVVAPGAVETDASARFPEEAKRAISSFTPLGRIGQPADIAGVIAFLASDDSRFVTGTYTPVNGGYVME